MKGSEAKWANPKLKMGNSLKCTINVINFIKRANSTKLPKYHKISAVSEMYFNVILKIWGSNSRFGG